MKFWSSNNIGDATLTASTADANFPVTNLQNTQISKLWKTKGTTATEYVVMDFGTNINPDSFIVAGHNFDGTETDVKIQGNASDSWGSPTVDETMTVTVGKPFVVSFTGSALRYWRFVFTKASSADVRSIGQVFIGTVTDTGEEGDPDYAGCSVVTVDPTQVVKSWGGQSYFGQKTPYDEIDLDFSFASETSQSVYRSLFDSVGKHTPWFIQISTISPLDLIYYVVFTNDYGRRVGAYGSEFYWDTKMSLEEQI